MARRKLSPERQQLHDQFLKAAELGNLKRVKALLRQRVPVNTKDSFRNTALHHAAYNGHLKLVKLLVRKGANLDARNGHLQTPLHVACLRGNYQVAKHLVENGAGLEEAGDGGHLPLHYAVNYDLKLVKLLLKHGAKPNGVNENDQTPLHLVGYGKLKEKKKIAIAKLLLKKGASLRVKDSWSETPLHRAGESGNRRLFKFLLEKTISNGLAPDQKDDNNNTPFDYFRDSMIDKARKKLGGK